MASKYSVLVITEAKWYLVCLPCVHQLFQSVSKSPASSVTVLQFRDQWINPVVCYAVQYVQRFTANCLFPLFDWTECQFMNSYFSTLFHSINATFFRMRNDEKYLYRVVGDPSCCNLLILSGIFC